MSSHHVVIEVVIYYLELVRNIKSPERRFGIPVRAGFVHFYFLE